MLNKLIFFIESNALFSRKDKILLAVSGGKDSVLMMHLLKDAGYNIAVMHCNFGLRGGDSDKDMEFVEEQAKMLNLQCFTQKFETIAYASQNGISTQMAARELRYNWFEKLREKQGFQYIATAHHQSDNCETIILNMLRGTGLRGLEGIPIARSHIVRPLMAFNANEIDYWVKCHNIAYREDASNASLKYKRNRVRHTLMPLIKEMNPSAEKALTNLADFSHQAGLLIQEYLNEKIVPNIQFKGDQVYIPISLIQQSDFGELILFELLREYGFQLTELRGMYSKLNAQAGKCFFSSTHQCLKDRDFIIVSKLTNLPDLNDTLASLEIRPESESVILPFGRILLQILQPCSISQLNQGSNVAFLDFDRLKFPLTVRFPKNGDYFYPLGLKGKKKISDFLTDKKIPRNEKARVLLLCSEKEIVWVVGYRIDERFKTSNHTQKILKIEFIPKG